MTIHSFIRFCLFCLIVTQLFACKKDVASPSATLPITASNVAGDFTVSSFVSITDQTSTFSGYQFTIHENGTITATKGNDTFNGTWKFDDSDSTEFKMSFSDAPLTELNKGWHIESLTDSRMNLTDDGGVEDPNDDHPSNHNSSLEFERD